MPKAISGVTGGARNFLEQAGADPVMQGHYTFSGSPESAPGQAYMDFTRSHKMLENLNPFARMMVNRLERGLERSPFALVNALKLAKEGDVAGANQALMKGTVGTLAGYGVNRLTPEDFYRNHPLLSRLVAVPLMGNYWLTGLGGMASKISGRPNETGMEYAQRAAGQGAKAIAKDLPGLYTMEDILPNRDTSAYPRAIVSNYISRPTVFMKRGADLADYLRYGRVRDVDPNAKGLTSLQKYFYPAAANIPFLRDVVPEREDTSANIRAFPTISFR
jgi:hypothetical protein